MSGERLPFTFDLRLWIDAPSAADARRLAVAFMAEARELAEAHPHVDVRWTAERRDRHGRPRIRIHPPPHVERGDGS